MYTAMLYLVFERQDRRLGHRIIAKHPITAQSLNDAKAQTEQELVKSLATVATVKILVDAAKKQEAPPDEE